jgi:hypothetical protein
MFVVVDSVIYPTNLKQIEKQIDRALFSSWSFLTIMMRYMNCYDEEKDEFFLKMYIYEKAKFISLIALITWISLYFLGIIQYFHILHFFVCYIFFLAKRRTRIIKKRILIY